MQIRFKNKYTMAIISMIEKGKALGGMPSVIEVSVDEALLIVNEINSLRDHKDTQHNRFRFTAGDKHNQIDARLQLVGKTLSAEEKFDVVTNWTKERFFVEFDSVPLRIIIEVQAKDKTYHD